MTYGVKWRISRLESQRPGVAGFLEKEGTLTTAWKLDPSIFRLKFCDLTCCSDWEYTVAKTHPYTRRAVRLLARP